MNCRIGDVALIVTPRVPSNRGAVVQVVTSRPGSRWVVRSLDGPRLCEDGSVSLEATVGDADLRPIKRGKPAILRRPSRRPSRPRQLALLAD